MTNSGEYIRGFTDYIILSILNKFNSYGYEMTKIINEVSQNSLQLTDATLYSALKRMQKDGLINSYLEKNKKGMSRRYYHITDNGKVSLKDFRKDWIIIENTLATLVGGTFSYDRED